MTHAHTIELIAPSGRPHDLDAARRGIERLRADGFEPRNAAVIERRFQRFAGTDAERVADLNRLADLSHPLPDAALAVRGGYGATRLLPLLDYDGLRARLGSAPTLLVGHSDFTAIQLALLARAGLVTWGGPMLCGDFGAEAPSDFTLRHFRQAVETRAVDYTSGRPQQDAVDVEGTLWGGNLAMLASLIGTPYWPQIDGGILFVEDVNEPPYRVERMLLQLHQAGILARQQALLIGDFSGYRLTDFDGGYDMAGAIERIRAVAGIPVIEGLPFGHTRDLLTLPVGGRARLTADEHGLRLSAASEPR